jgi:hypothetical protein
MANYKISGVWKDTNNVITHYAFHSINENSISRATKKTKAEAIKLLNDPANSAVTWLWNYSVAYWRDGQKVSVINNSYLRSDPDNKLTDNLAHLIDYDWLS